MWLLSICSSVGSSAQLHVVSGRYEFRPCESLNFFQASFSAIFLIAVYLRGTICHLQFIYSHTNHSCALFCVGFGLWLVILLYTWQDMLVINCLDSLTGLLGNCPEGGAISRIFYL